ncbi:MAG: IPT/TIG domain-containing protein, partial [Candidatus Geothermincolia bacterium]
MNKRILAASALLCALALVGAFAVGCGSVTPTITMISPTSGAGGTAVAITGNGFGKTQGTNKVLFTSTEAKVVSWSDTGIAIKVPADLKAGSYMVKVVLGSTNSNQIAFKVTAAASSDASKPGEVEHNTPVEAMLAYLKAKGEPTTGWTFQVDAVSKSDPNWKIDASFYTGNPQAGFWLLHKVNGTWQVLA